ncbi:MAG: hypothetical protein FWE56_04825 [Candidatus Bathyarchaeota archaeon]|nr:hypothetical protein [Candidatus Termiticorpusculum sp.]MCL2868789.1 hypothetical protein [Candidatus Termiticorpusculum sp.]
MVSIKDIEELEKQLGKEKIEQTVKEMFLVLNEKNKRIATVGAEAVHYSALLDSLMQLCALAVMHDIFSDEDVANLEEFFKLLDENFGKYVQPIARKGLTKP